MDMALRSGFFKGRVGCCKVADQTSVDLYVKNGYCLWGTTELRCDGCHYQKAVELGCDTRLGKWGSELGCDGRPKQIRE